MGRWAQRQLRGGGAQGVNPTPPLIQITSVSSPGGQTLVIDFDAPVTYSGGGGIQGFDVQGGALNSGVQSGPAQITAEADNAFSPGDAWSLPAQPGEIPEPLDVPAAGLIT